MILSVLLVSVHLYILRDLVGRHQHVPMPVVFAYHRFFVSSNVYRKLLLYLLYWFRFYAIYQCSAFPLCTACSSNITAAYRKDPAAFVQAVCAQPQVLEEISGVTEMVSHVDVNLCIDSDDDF